MDKPQPLCAESADPTAPAFNAALCNACGLCALACPCGAIVMTSKGPAFACRARCRHSPECIAVREGIHPCEITCSRGAIAGRFEIRI